MINRRCQLADGSVFPKAPALHQLYDCPHARKGSLAVRNLREYSPRPHGSELVLVAQKNDTRFG